MPSTPPAEASEACCKQNTGLIDVLKCNLKECPWSQVHVYSQGACSPDTMIGPAVRACSSVTCMCFRCMQSEHMRGFQVHSHEPGACMPSRCWHEVHAPKTQVQPFPPGCACMLPGILHAVQVPACRPGAFVPSRCLHAVQVLACSPSACTHTAQIRVCSSGSCACMHLLTASLTYHTCLWQHRQHDQLLTSAAKIKAVQ